nr:MAG TPA_asm: hypothetical protein [Caudoviricetes sp.]
MPLTRIHRLWRPVSLPGPAIWVIRFIICSNC